MNIRFDKRVLDKAGEGNGDGSPDPIAAQSTVDTDALKRQAVKDERQRINDIRMAVNAAKLDQGFAQDLIDRGVSADEARAEVLKKLAAQPQPEVQGNVRVEVGQDEHDKKRDGISEAILFRIDRNAFKPGQGNPFVGYSLLRMLENLIGRPVGMSDTQFATRAMSSSDLPYILGNVAEKSVQQKYSTQPRTWSRWASTGTLRNFKTHDSMRSGDFSSLEERQENGEFKTGSFSEEREQVTLKEFGKEMAFTRRMLINDDLGEISRVTAQAGSSASRLENYLVYQQLSSNPTMGDGVALFHANHSNLASPGALTDSEIGEAFKLMREQTSVDGLEKLNLAPRFLICGPQNEVTARKYLTVISPTQASNVNVFSNSLELIIDAEISNDDYFFAADPNLIETVKLFHLEGEESPRIESYTNQKTEAVVIRVAHSCVAKAMDWRGLVMNATS